MRRRFGRGRRGKGSGDGRAAAIDAARVFERMVAEGIVGAASLEPAAVEGVPASLAVVGSGESAEGVPLVVGYAPWSGGDAALAALAFAQQRAAQGGFEGEAVAVAPQWSIASRHRLRLIAAPPFRFRALVASSLVEGPCAVETEVGADAPPLPAHHLAAQLERGSQRDLFLRALAAFEGLAAKHGGAVRGVGASAELVLLARRVALLREQGGAIVLDTILPEKSSVKLASDGLAAAMDRLEGLLRKRLNDRRLRGGEEGLRAQLLPLLAAAADVRGPLFWPQPGSDPEVLDLAGVDATGIAVAGAVRARMTLADLGAILDAALALQPALPSLLGSDAPLRRGPPRLLLAATDFDAAVPRVLPLLALESLVFDIRTRRGRGPELVVREPLRASETALAAEPPAGAEAPVAGESRRERRPRRGRANGAKEPEAGGFEEISLFDLEEEGRAASAEGKGGDLRRRRRSRGRRRGRRPGAAGPAGPGEDSATSEAPERAPERAEETVEDEGERGLLAADDSVDFAQTLAPLGPDVPDLEEVTEPLAEAEELPGEGEPEAAAERREPAEEAEPAAVPLEVEAAFRMPRRRAVFVSHADRDSLLATIVLARDVRLIDSLWVYPQSELMTFFRSVATDKREETPIYVVGFVAKPARDALQAAALYRGRLAWFDHHDWPPEDLEGLRQTIGREAVHVHPGTGSSLLGVLECRARRSRFSDKLIELATGRFSQHDFERWGRIWWYRLGEIAQRSGECRGDVEPLLIGRPSDLAQEAASAALPPLPPEVQYVSRRDFRLVHFGGYTLAIVPVPAELDPHLVARVTRERYDAQLSLAFGEGEELVILAGDESRGRHGLDLGAMVDHLAAKHDWIELLPGSDHVARMRVRELATRPERLDDLIGEIAMGRSILEG